MRQRKDAKQVLILSTKQDRHECINKSYQTLDQKWDLFNSKKEKREKKEKTQLTHKEVGDLLKTVCLLCQTLTQSKDLLICLYFLLLPF